MTGKRRETQVSRKKPERLIFCCSGASNVGFLANLAAIRLAQEGFGNFSCIAGIGGKIPAMIRSAKNAPERIVIDGCPIGCAKRIMDSNQVPVDCYIVVTELGVQKTHDFDIDDRDVDTVIKGVRHSQHKAPPVGQTQGRG